MQVAIVLLFLCAARVSQGVNIRGRGDPSPSSDLCPDVDSCAVCVLYEHCGWCHVEGEDAPKCVRGSRPGPTSSSETCAAWKYSQCEGENSLDFWTQRGDEVRNVSDALKDRIQVYGEDIQFAKNNVEQLKVYKEDIKSKRNRIQLKMLDCQGAKKTREDAAKDETKALEKQKADLASLESEVEQTVQNLQQLKNRDEQTESVISSTAELETTLNQQKESVKRIRDDLPRMEQRTRVAMLDLATQTKECDKYERQMKRIEIEEHKIEVNQQYRTEIANARAHDVNVLQTIAKTGLSSETGGFTLEALHDAFPLGTMATSPEIDIAAEMPEMPKVKNLPATGGSVLLHGN